MIELDAATVLLQWAVGGLAFLWVTTREREVGIGYGWLMRSVFGLMAGGALWIGLAGDTEPVREAATAGVVVATSLALAVSVRRRRAGVRGERERLAARTVDVSEMTGIDRRARGPRDDVAEFPPALDAVAPAIGVVGLVAAGLAAGGPVAHAVARTLAGAAFLGAVTDAMLLGHWYLVQPGLGRGPLRRLVAWSAATWPPEVALLLVPVGMVSVLNGTIDDGYGGILGWFWVASAITTIVLIGVTWIVLQERQYSAVMAATGFLYLAILTAFGTDLVARAVLA